MIDTQTIDDIQKASVTERIHLMEVLLHSLKKDMDRVRNYQLERRKPFTVRVLNLGNEVLMDRNSMYSERGIDNVCD